MSHEKAGEWFTVASGTRAGQVRLVGWSMSAVGAVPWSSAPGVGIATCPRCHALVLSENVVEGISGEVVRHEDWHAATDYPRPTP